MTLNARKFDDRTGHQHSYPLPVPVGWQIADGNADDVRVCGAHAWQSNTLVFANGHAYGTAAHPDPSYLGATRAEKNILNFASRLKIGKKCSGGHLQQDGKGVRTPIGYSDVLLRRRA